MRSAVAHAMVARGYPRFTVDVEHRLGDVQPDVRTLWRELLHG